jgi:hypothetical protein
MLIGYTRKRTQTEEVSEGDPLHLPFFPPAIPTPTLSRRYGRRLARQMNLHYTSQCGAFSFAFVAPCLHGEWPSERPSVDRAPQSSLLLTNTQVRTSEVWRRGWVGQFGTWRSYAERVQEPLRTETEAGHQAKPVWPSAKGAKRLWRVKNPERSSGDGETERPTQSHRHAKRTMPKQNVVN